jgi:hypothetical protein
MSCGGRIAILPGQSKAEEFCALVHELVHEMLHKAERPSNPLYWRNDYAAVEQFYNKPHHEIEHDLRV